MCERLAGDRSRWRSSGGGWSLQRVAASGVLYVGDNDAVAVASLDSSPGLRWCSVLLRALFACVVCVCGVVRFGT
jgi:hypothetical protein